MPLSVLIKVYSMIYSAKAEHQLRRKYHSAVYCVSSAQKNRCD
ncbi:hypothetical protein PAUR_a2728 [Pseudoalteromonas aurantia 208]|uniref:Uncharacterized protein n=1 Tax=Pseudoalteromonas aurantia 208 TaxID=1314867 RepID=A0ABR9EDB4_9GAMM|nr:hypothetical protein [Pseudoalteromonas aurantia 208]